MNDELTKSLYGLSRLELDILIKIFFPYADKINRVALFGSRATGNFKSNSDIDLVIYGQLNKNHLDRLFTLFSESHLSLKVDLAVYHLIDYLPLKNHIDQVALILFTKKDLELARVV